MTKNVLIVDDDPGLRERLARRVRELGYEPQEASDVSSALERLKRTGPALICLDLVLPDGSGYDLCEEVRRSPELAGVPLLCWSERGLAVDRMYAAAAGATDFLSKPFSGEEFSRKLAALIGGRARGGE